MTLDADLVSYRAKVANLESKVGTSEREAKKRRLEAQQLLDEEVEKAKLKDERIEELRRQRTVLYEREKAVNEQLEATRDKLESDKKSYEQRIQKIVSEKEALKHKLDEVSQRNIILVRGMILLCL